MNKYWYVFLSLLTVAVDAHAGPAVVAFMATYGSTIAAVGTAISAVSAISGGMAARDSAKYNAQVAENNAIASRQQAAANAEQQQRQARLQIGQMEANYSASGVSLEGSPLEILEQSARNSEMDRLNIIYGGELRASGYGNEASLNRSRASNAMTTGYLKAGSALMSGAARTGQLTREPMGATSGYDYIDSSTYLEGY